MRASLQSESHVGWLICVCLSRRPNADAVSACDNSPSHALTCRATGFRAPRSSSRTRPSRSPSHPRPPPDTTTAGGCLRRTRRSTKSRSERGRPRTGIRPNGWLRSARATPCRFLNRNQIGVYYVHVHVPGASPHLALPDLTAAAIWNCLAAPPSSAPPLASPSLPRHCAIAHHCATTTLPRDPPTHPHAHTHTHAHTRHTSLPLSPPSSQARLVACDPVLCGADMVFPRRRYYRGQIHAGH